MDTEMPPPEKYSTQLAEIQDKSETLFTEFTHLFVMSKMYPTNQEIQQQYQSIIGVLNQIKTDLFTTSTELQTNIDELNRALLELNIMINKERSVNRQLKKQLKNINSEHNTTTELIDNYNEMYSIQYLKNWSLVISSVIVLFMVKRFLPPTLPSPSS